MIATTLRGIFTASVILFSASLFAAPQADLSASRTSGPAPLAVFFDATGTTDSNSSVNAFRQLGYHFRFDDPSSGSWGTSGKSKNEQIGGPTAAHIFRSPGNYTVSVTATDSSGQATSATVNITVTDPNSAYSGNSTIVISRNSDTSGAPSGADIITNASSWPQFSSNRRYLLKAGQDFTSLGSINFDGISNSQVGAFGSGSRPRVNGVHLFSWDGVVLRNNAVYGLDMNSYSASHQINHSLILDSDIRGNGGATDFTMATGFYQTPDSWLQPVGLFAVNTHVHGNSDYGMYIGGAEHLVLMGNTITTWGPQHGARIINSYKSFIGHNLIEGRNTGQNKHLLKLNGGGLSNWESTRATPGQATRYVVISDNILGHSSNQSIWKVTVSPQNGLETEGIEDVITESNTFVTTNDVEVLFGGRRLIERGHNNIDTRTNTHSDALPSNWRGPYYLNDPVIGGSSNPAPPAISAPLAPSLQIQIN